MAVRSKAAAVRSVLRGTVTAALVSAAAVAGWAGAASAHVTIDASTVAPKGGFATVTVDVPNERSDASTVKLSIQLPQDQVVAFTSVQPKPGWSVETTTRKLGAPVTGDDGTIDQVVDTITWTADPGSGIGPGQFDQFRISMGQLPTDVDSLPLPAVQTYDDGEAVRWIETAADAQHPAPRLLLSAAGADSHGTGSHGADSPAAPPAGSGDDESGDVLAGVALGVALLALLAAGAAIVASRRGPAT